MSFLRQCLQQISRQVSATLPKNIRLINYDIIDKYQKVQDATIDFYRQRQISLNRGGGKSWHKLQFLGKLFGFVAASVCAAATYKKISNKTSLVPTAKAEPKKEPIAEPNLNAIKNEKLENEFIPMDCRVIEYENRLRNYSSPEKIFRYFATVCMRTEKGTQIMMTPDDFLRSLYPGRKLPSKFGLDRFRVIDKYEIGQKLDLQLRKDSIFSKLGLKGLITFPDYLFLMTLLLTPSRHFKIAFQIFDYTGAGVLVAEEFEGVTALARQSVTFAATGHDNYRKSVSRRLLKCFFGRDLKGKLTIADFLKFKRDFKNEILTLEFDSKPADEFGFICERDFADLLIAYAGYNAKEKEHKLRRIQKHFKYNQRGLSRQDYLDFWEILNNLNDVEMALSFYHLANASIDKATFHHVARTVVKVNLSEHVVDVAFTIFDDNEDNQFIKNEFLDVMKKRINRGNEQKPGANFVALIQAFKKCALERRSYDF